MTNQSLLAVRDLSIRYSTAGGGVQAVDHVSISIRRGEVVGIVGESGSGKSTVALAVLGLLDQDTAALTGDIEFEGTSLVNLPRRDWQGVRGRRIGMIFQSPEASFNPIATIGAQICEAIACHFAVSKREARERALAALNQVGMPRAAEVMHSYAFELSGGMCQRAAMAMTLALRPSLLLADEPTASLDVLAQAELVGWLTATQRRQGFSMMVISHDLAMISRVAHRVVVMYGGRVVETGATDAVMARPRHPYTSRLLNAVPRLERGGVALESSGKDGAVPGHVPERGCGYAVRCAWASYQCVSGDAPALRAVEDGLHAAACHHPLPVERRA